MLSIMKNKKISFTVHYYVILMNDQQQSQINDVCKGWGLTFLSFIRYNNNNNNNRNHKTKLNYLKI